MDTNWDAVAGQSGKWQDAAGVGSRGGRGGTREEVQHLSLRDVAKPRNTAL